MGNPHVLAIPYPAQGHVIPLLELSLSLVHHGFEVTYVNTDFNHERIIKTLSDKEKLVHDLIHLVSIPDGLEIWEDRNDLGKLSEAIFDVMPRKLKELIENINESDSNKITCVIADENMGWALDVAEKLGIRRTAFWPSSAAFLALVFSVPKLIDEGIMNNNGTLTRNEMIQLSPNMPALNTPNLPWACFGDLATQKVVFNVVAVKNNKSVKNAEWLICNSSYDLETAAFTLFPNILPIGPLLSRNALRKSVGHFWTEDSTCLKWLDQQLPQSVIYVAFGSFTVFDRIQFQELALGLELANRPFLWIVRPDITSELNEAYPKGFIERVGIRGKMVSWAPQQDVLNHPSIACFLSHCGWNSTLEGVSNAVPFLCWPYFGDQFINQSYISDVWKVGLQLDRDENGIISREEIKNKVEQLVGDKTFKGRALDIKEKITSSIKEGGYSNNNFRNFIEWMEEKKSS